MTDSPRIVLLTMGHFETAYGELVKFFEGDPEPMPAWREGDTAKLETLSHCTEVEAFGVQKYPEFHVKAAKLFYSGVKLHAFPNGNKRFGLMVTLFFLLVNGHQLAADSGASAIAKLVANTDPHTEAGKPDIVVSLIADAYFKHNIQPRERGETD